jgi:hypothetical protein
MNMFTKLIMYYLIHTTGHLTEQTTFVFIIMQQKKFKHKSHRQNQAKVKRIVFSQTNASFVHMV